MAQAKKAPAKVGTVENKEDKLKALNTMISQIEREYGAGSIMRLGENSKMEVQAVSTGSLSLSTWLSASAVCPEEELLKSSAPNPRVRQLSLSTLSLRYKRQAGRRRL